MDNEKRYETAKQEILNILADIEYKVKMGYLLMIEKEDLPALRTRIIYAIGIRPNKATAEEKRFARF